MKIRFQFMKGVIMGSWNETCGISQVPILVGHKDTLTERDRSIEEIR